MTLANAAAAVRLIAWCRALQPCSHRLSLIAAA